MNLPMSTFSPAKIRQTTGIITALSVLPHIFCCGIPAIATLISLGTTVGLAASLASNPFYQFVDTYHRELIIIAVSSVVLSGILNFIAWRIDCRESAKQSLVQGHCAHADCTPKKTMGFKLFFISLILLALDLTWFYTEEYVLGLHHHDTAASSSHQH